MNTKIRCGYQAGNNNNYHFPFPNPVLSNQPSKAYIEQISAERKLDTNWNPFLKYREQNVKCEQYRS